MTKVRVMWAFCGLLVAIGVWHILSNSAGSAPPGEWGELTGGSPAAHSRQMLPNADFTAELLTDWAQKKIVHKGPAENLQGGVDSKGGREGGAFRLGPGQAGKAEVAGRWTMPITHNDYFLDGYAKPGVKSGKAWVGIEMVFEGANGETIASYLSWRGANGGRPEKKENQYQDEMAPADNGWGRIATRTTYDLRQKGLSMPKKPTFITVYLWLGLEDADAQAWFDDLDLRDMKVGR